MKKDLEQILFFQKIKFKLTKNKKFYFTLDWFQSKKKKRRNEMIK